MAIPRPRRPSHAVPALLLVAFLAAAAIGCERDGEPSGTIDGLVILAGGSGPARAFAHDAAGARRDLPLPGDATTWLAISVRGDGAATLEDGTLHVAEQVGRTEPGSWTAERPTEADGDPVAGPLAFPAWSPEGERVALLWTDFAEAPLRLVIHAPRTDGSLVIPLEGRALPAPPVWLDEERVLILRPDPNGTAGALVAIVDTTTGEVADGPAGGPAVDVADDASRIAVSNVARTRLDVFPADGWIGGAASEGTIRTDQPINQLAFDRSGERLAAVVEGAAGEPPGIRVYAAADGWREIRRLDVPGGAPLAAVAWLP